MSMGTQYCRMASDGEDHSPDVGMLPRQPLAYAPTAAVPARVLVSVGVRISEGSLSSLPSEGA